MTENFLLTQKVNLLEKQIKNLHAQIGKLQALIEFHNGKVPLKYRKAFFGEREDPYFRAGPFVKRLPLVQRSDMITGIDPEVEYIFIPDDPQELKKATQRKNERYAMSQKDKETAEKGGKPFFNYYSIYPTRDPSEASRASSGSQDDSQQSHSSCDR